MAAEVSMYQPVQITAESLLTGVDKELSRVSGGRNRALLFVRSEAGEFVLVSAFLGENGTCNKVYNAFRLRAFRTGELREAMDVAMRKFVEAP
jgi:hypothetical protein